MITRIRKKRVDHGENSFPTPGKYRKRSEHRNEQCDDFDFYVNQRVVPTCEKLLIAVKQKINNFPWGKLSLR